MIVSMRSPTRIRRGEAPEPTEAFVSPRLLARAVIAVLVVDIVLAWLSLVGMAVFVESADTRLDLGRGMQLLVGGAQAEIAADVLAIVVVRRITSFQEEAFQRQGRGGQPA